MCAQLATSCRKSNDAFDVLLALDGSALTSQSYIWYVYLLAMVCPSLHVFLLPSLSLGPTICNSEKNNNRNLLWVPAKGQRKTGTVRERHTYICIYMCVCVCMKSNLAGVQIAIKTSHKCDCNQSKMKLERSQAKCTPTQKMLVQSPPCTVGPEKWGRKLKFQGIFSVLKNRKASE